VNEKPGLTTR